MILTALNELAEREQLLASPHFEEKAVSYVLVINEAGRLLGIQGLSEPAEGEKKPPKKYFLVPRPLPGARRSGTKIDPAFLVDNPSFVLGVNAPGDREKKSYDAKELAERQAGFRSLIAAIEEATGDAGLRAVRLFLDDVIARGQTVSVPEKLKSNELLAFRFEPDVGVLVHERPAVVEYWNRFRLSRESQGGGERATFPCLVTNRPCRPVEKHPLIKKVPGGTPSGVALVSFNNETFESYGLEGNENAPMSREAAEAYTTALARLLDDTYPHPRDRTPMPRRNFRLSDDTTVVFWSGSESAVLDLFGESIQHADPEAVAALYSATWKGRPVKLDDPSAFYALTISGGQGRATIRGWFESTVREVMLNVRRHFDDLKIVGRGAEEQQSFPLGQLLRRTAVQGKSENIAPGLAAAVFEAILKGWPYPRLLLDAAVRRARAERSIFPDRAALIKAYLVRARRLGRLPSLFPEVKPMLDRDCAAPAYRLGRLFAVLEKVQADATNASTTIRERFYGAASATPVVVFGQLLRKAPHHLAKLDHAPFFERLIQEILSALQPPNPFPLALNLEEQGLFALGYHHQRQDLFTKRSDEGKGGDGATQDADDTSNPSEGE
jgi:CRISPR-associated protein Csd1